MTRCEYNTTLTTQNRFVIKWSRIYYIRSTKRSFIPQLFNSQENKHIQKSASVFMKWNLIWKLQRLSEFLKGHNHNIEKEQASVHDAMKEFACVAQKSFVAVFEKTRFLSVSVKKVIEMHQFNGWCCVKQLTFKIYRW